MRELKFHKYQGTGNDFIMIDDRENLFDHENLPLIHKLCDRRFGVGADGVILLRNHDQYHFEMVYFNPDGSQSLCGNGSRCAVKFARQLGMIENKCHFLAVDGPHEGFIRDDQVHIKMPDVNSVESRDDAFFVNTGSPHHVKVVAELSDVNVYEEGRNIRYSAAYGPDGTNVNFVEVNNEFPKIRTYERGVENETLSCGTGVTAVALVLSTMGSKSPLPLETRGGRLQVSFKGDHQRGFKDVYLIGPAREVFRGVYRLD